MPADLAKPCPLSHVPPPPPSSSTAAKTQVSIANVVLAIVAVLLAFVLYLLYLLRARLVPTCTPRLQQ